jgi:methyl-accepting chemotaxis protein
MNHWRIRTQLLVSFLLTLAFVTAPGALAILALGKIEADAQHISADSLPGLHCAARVRAETHILSRHALGVATGEDTAELREHRQTLGAAFDDYAGTVRSTPDRELLKETRTKFAAFEQSLDELEKLAAAGPRESVLALYRSRVQPNHELAAAAATKLVDFNRDGCDRAGAEIQAEVGSARRHLAIGLGLAVLAGLIIATWLARRIATRLAQTAQCLARLSEGDLTVVPQVTSTDEIGQAMQMLGTVVHKLRSVVGSIDATATSVATGSEQMSAAAGQLAHGASEQSAATSETTSSLEQITSSVQQNTDNARSTEKLAIKAAKDATASGEAVARTVAAMTEVAGKIAIIEEIARKTDLLALNAAVEAARAGDHGKGFAVVASEVRKLAERSQTAAAEIGLVSGNGVAIAQQAGALLTGLVPDIKKTAELVQEISAASSEQNLGIGQINKAIVDLDQVSQRNAAGAEEMSTTADDLAHHAEGLRTTIAFFRLGANAERPPVASKRRAGATAARRPTTPAYPPVDSAAPPPAAPQRKSGGIDLLLNPSGETVDALDRDFRSY